MKLNLSWATPVLFLGVAMAYGQPKPPADPPTNINERLMEIAKGESTRSVATDYRIGSEDLLEISVFEVPELSRSARVSATGEISLPLIGAFHVAGMSPVDLEQEIRARLKRTYVKDPQVSVFLKEFKSDPVSVVGAVKMPGLYTIQTRKTLIEVLAMAQGFPEGLGRQPGRTIIVTRKADSYAVSEGETKPNSPQSIEIPIKALLQTGEAKWNVPIYPGDVIKVLAAGTIYVVGDVSRPGGFPLNDFDNMSALQALAMAGGTTKAASKKNSVIIRRDASGNRIEERVDLARVLKGGGNDVMLGPNDILFVPGSIGKESALRALELALQSAAGVLIYKPL